MKSSISKSKKAHHHHIRGRYPDFDPFVEIESGLGTELPGKSHRLSEKPTKFLKRARGYDEKYRPMHRR